MHCMHAPCPDAPPRYSVVRRRSVAEAERVLPDFAPRPAHELCPAHVPGGESPEQERDDAEGKFDLFYRWCCRFIIGHLASRREGTIRKMGGQAKKSQKQHAWTKQPYHGVFPDDHISPLSLKSTTIMLASRMRLLLALTCSMAA